MPRAENTPFMTADQLLTGWTPGRVGRQIVLLDEVDSTNTAALQAVETGAGDGLVILADTQSQGRGRLGASWLSPRGASVLCSVVLMFDTENTGRSGSTGRRAHKEQVRTSARLTQVSAVAACEAIRSATEVAPAIKWPNDIRVDHRKLGGILIESRTSPQGQQAWVVGIGLNCLQHAGHFPPELRGQATSLDLEASHPVDRTAVARELLRALDRWIAPANWERQDLIHAAWLELAEPLGQKVRVRREGREYAGWTVEIDPAGGLILRLETGQVEWFDPMLTTLL